MVRCDSAPAAQDDSDFFGGGARLQDGGAKSVTTNLAASSAVELSSTKARPAPTRISNIEFKAIRAPGVTNATVG